MKPLRLFIAFAILGIVCALLRWVQTGIVVPGETVRFKFVHDVTWDEANQILTRTGADPYVWFELPAKALPIREVSIDFGGPYVPTEGSYYLFQFTGSEPDLKMGPLVTATVSSTPNHFVVSGQLDNSAALRLDLPDFLPRPIQLQRMMITKPFATRDSVLFLLSLVGLIGAVVSAVPAARTFRRRA